MKKWITFDLDGTLMQNPFVSYVFPEIERRILLENEKLKNIVGHLVAEHETRLKDGRTAAAYDWDDIVLHYLKTNSLQLFINVEEILRGFCVEPNIYLLEDTVFEVLSELKQSGFSLAVVTNGFTKYQLPVMNALKLTDHFDLIVTPEEVGLAKPDQRVYDSVLKQGEIIAHVGDRIDHDVISANAVGVRSIWIYRRMPDWMKELSPAERRGLSEMQELVLEKFAKEMKKRVTKLSKEAIPQDVICSLSELPSMLRG
ncbi:HAD family hydrolase [Sporosarcina sp. ACRSL]|uniref:HAD family hydrolase n=1 Tax=Sporosarcina sp. ACRSL TaxID=2918215 RepID=UPI001EF42ECA|nr:HAD family hydrolase [Sporosarcina sp. ACRSL]MCG7344197.1 HAD family hydrolase [Sporosarcina sp. ACRSL]